MSKTFLFQVIYSSQKLQFSISIPLVLLNPSLGPFQVLPRRAGVDLGVMEMKGCSTFPKAPASLEPHHQIVVIYQDTHWVGSYPFAEVQSVYSTTLTDWAIYIYIYIYTLTHRLISGSLVEWLECSPMIPGRVIPKTLKMVLDTSLLNT